MLPDTVCKTVHQYNKETVSPGNMEKLLQIAEDYKKVKNYVYLRYGGIRSLSKLYPGYAIQNEMTRSSLRDDLELPSVYFYMAIFDALGDIKTQWSRTKRKVLESVSRNERFSMEEKHYLRFLIKVSNAFEAVLNQKPVKLPEKMQKTYEELAAQINAEKLHRYLCRQTRKYHVKQHTDMADGFYLTERAYRYGDNGIYISTKEKRKRVFVPLTDHNQYRRQFYIKLYPEQGNIVIHVPVDVAVRHHRDYLSQIGVSMGMYTMLTTDAGHRYGEEFGRRQQEYAEWIRQQTIRYSRNRKNNPGRKKYAAGKRRLTEKMHSYVNQELNRFLQTEKPKVIYLAKLPKPQAGGMDKKINYSVSQWQRGYIRKRLIQKCREQSVEMVEVFGKGISSECSSCGAVGKKQKGWFFCPACGYGEEEKTNTARNARKRGNAATVIRTAGWINNGDEPGFYREDQQAGS